MKSNASFSARQITTTLNWSDVILDQPILEQVLEISKRLFQGEASIKAFFYGPPDTGKTLTTTLIGKTAQRDVYRVDLSAIVSKYIGETEKNLAKIFEAAANKSWILFFDEADALFGKRTEVSDSHDRYANQEISYLLQQIEAFKGLVILASNSAENIDEACAKRFQFVINFKMPSTTER